MTIYRLFEEPLFPDAEEADPDGLLAIGGDLSPDRLIAAYASGIFPWYGPDSPILWWSPDPRLVLEPKALHVPASLRRVINSGRFHLTLDRDFGAVIRACARVARPGQNGTWIVPDMVAAYERLHRLGFAHSAECWEDGELVGGLYGVSLGSVFFGESMFHARPDASKALFASFVGWLANNGCTLIDCQQTTPHLLRFGAREITRKEFLKRLAEGVQAPSLPPRWNFGSFVSDDGLGGPDAQSLQ